jgi:hypothetical protein
MIRPVMAALAAFALAAPAVAQDSNQAAIAAQKEAIKKLSGMFGVWRGPGSGMNRSGPYQVTQTERIGTMLDGTIMVIEGKGYTPDGKVAFNAFGVISYDAATKVYTLRSHALGYSGDFPLTLTDTGYVWSIPAGPGATIRYTATFSGGTWNEVGDYVAGEAPPRRIFEMNLKRVGDTDWPSGGGIAKD